MKTAFLNKRGVIRFASLFFVVLGFCTITYGVTRWQTTHLVLEKCRERVPNAHVVKVITPKVVDDKDTFTLKEVDGVMTYVYKSIASSQGPYDWMDGAMICAFFGLSAIAIGYYRYKGVVRRINAGNREVKIGQTNPPD